MNVNAGSARRAIGGLVGAILLCCMSISSWASETPSTLQGVKVITASEAKQMFDRGVPFIEQADGLVDEIRAAVERSLTRAVAEGIREIDMLQLELHDELIRHGGRYAQMYALQASRFDSGEARTDA